MLRMHAAAGPDVIRTWYGSGPVVNILGTVRQSHNEVLNALLESARLAVGHSTVIGAVATDPSGRACALTLLPRDATPLSRPTRSALACIAAHLASAYRLRGGTENDDDAVLDPDGRLLHATDDTLGRDGATSLRSAAIAIDRARRQDGTDPERALAYWKAMVDGKWTLVERFQSDGRRILVARPNAPATRVNRALTENERKVVAFATLCHPSKLIAYELGFAEAAVSRLLQRALKKLGIRTLAELIEVHGAIVGNGNATPP